MLLAAPVRAVIFDLHQTLLDGGDAARWLDDGWRAAARPGTAAEGFGDDQARVLDLLDRIWEHVSVLDPHARRDLDPEYHRQVTLETLEAHGIDPGLARALHAVMLDRWRVYDDTAMVLRGLRERGVRTGLLTNIGVDPRPLLDAAGVLDLLDAVTVSYEIGHVKPEPEAFQAALDSLGTRAEETLMVGDAFALDGAAAALGMRTLVLPRTRGAVHGLELVLRLVG